MRLSKRETLTQNMTLMAIMAAINVIISVLATFVPALSVFLMILLPLTSVIVVLYCKAIYFPLYAIATMGLCLLVTMYNMEYSIFYIFPSLVTGFAFGFLVKFNIHSSIIVLLTSLLQLAITAAMIPFINFLFETDLILTFKTAFALQESVYIDTIIPLFMFMCALAQMAFSYIAISSEIKKFNHEVNSKENNAYLFFAGAMISFTLELILAFYYPSVAYLFFGIGIFISFYPLIYLLLAKKMWIYISLGAGFLLTFFLFGGLYSLVKVPCGLLLLSVFFVIVSLISLIHKIYLSRSKKDTIKTQEVNND